MPRGQITQGAEWGKHFRKATLEEGDSGGPTAVWVSQDGGVGQSGSWGNGEKWLVNKGTLSKTGTRCWTWERVAS